MEHSRHAGNAFHQPLVEDGAASNAHGPANMYSAGSGFPAGPKASVGPQRDSGAHAVADSDHGKSQHCLLLAFKTTSAGHPESCAKASTPSCHWLLEKYQDATLFKCIKCKFIVGRASTCIFRLNVPPGGLHTRKQVFGFCLALSGGSCLNEAHVSAFEACSCSLVSNHLRKAVASHVGPMCPEWVRKSLLRQFSCKLRSASGFAELFAISSCTVAGPDWTGQPVATARRIQLNRFLGS